MIGFGLDDFLLCIMAFTDWASGHVIIACQGRIMEVSTNAYGIVEHLPEGSIWCQLWIGV